MTTQERYLSELNARLCGLVSRATGLPLLGTTGKPARRKSKRQEAIDKRRADLRRQIWGGSKRE